MEYGVARGSAAAFGPHRAECLFDEDSQSPDTFFDPIDRNAGYGQSEAAVFSVSGEEMAAGGKDHTLSSALRE
jgi:hypothetical protein